MSRRSAAGAARFHCVLVGPDRSEVYLTGGPQTIGRGHGGTTTKRISHKQLSVIANTHTGVALVRGYTPKTVPGWRWGGGPRQALGTEDEVELMNGDMVALIMDEGADEEETSVEGVFMYKVTRWRTSSPRIGLLAVLVTSRRRWRRRDARREDGEGACAVDSFGSASVCDATRFEDEREGEEEESASLHSRAPPRFSEGVMTRFRPMGVDRARVSTRC